MKLALGSDHAGFDKKTKVLAWLQEHGHFVTDFGAYSLESVDYPDYAKKVALEVASGNAEQGVLLCGSGVGVSIVANKIKGIRAALVFNEDVARLARQHNNANVICLPARFMTDDTVFRCLENWFSSSFEGGRHEQRVLKIETPLETETGLL